MLFRSYKHKGYGDKNLEINPVYSNMQTINSEYINFNIESIDQVEQLNYLNIRHMLQIMAQLLNIFSLMMQIQVFLKYLKAVKRKDSTTLRNCRMLYLTNTIMLIQKPMKLLKS